MIVHKETKEVLCERQSSLSIIEGEIVEEYWCPWVCMDKSFTEWQEDGYSPCPRFRFSEDEIDVVDVKRRW